MRCMCWTGWEKREAVALPKVLDAKVCEALGDYVYALEDPRFARVFYVGRGTNDRVLHHLRDALGTDEPGAKLETIRDILRSGDTPKAWILRRRIGHRPGAAEIEAVVIDVLSRWHARLANRVRGAGSEDGIRSLEGIIADHAATPLETARPAIVVNIGRTWFEGISGAELWDAARKWWLCRPEERRRQPRLLLAEAGNIVRGAWSVELPPRRQMVTWEDFDERRQTFSGTKLSFTPFAACCFDGVRDPEWDALVGRHTRPPVLPRSYGSAFRYLNC